MALMGCLEFSDTSYVRGWAYDPNSPSLHLEVVVRIGEDFCASGRADVHRADLLRAGIGDGSHGFDIDLSESELTPSDSARLRVHAISGAESVELFRSAEGSRPAVALVSEPSLPTCNSSSYPVFVLGAARSGTSAVALGLLESGRYAGMAEGHVAPLMYLLSKTVDDYYERDGVTHGTTLGRVPREAFHDFLRRAFVQLANELFPTSHWLDKTPTVEMVRAAPLLKEIWPNARFLFMKRRVIENVMSQQRKGSIDLTRNYYLDWVAVMSEWLAVRESLAAAAIEIDHRELVLNPSGTATAIAEFLEMPEGEDREHLRRYICEKHPEQTDPNFGATYSLNELGLDQHDEQRLIAACETAMAAYGYTFDNSYYAEPGASGSFT